MEEELETLDMLRNYWSYSCIVRTFLDNWAITRQRIINQKDNLIDYYADKAVQQGLSDTMTDLYICLEEKRRSL